jgi:hypothetical protein
LAFALFCLPNGSAATFLLISLEKLGQLGHHVLPLLPEVFLLVRIISKAVKLPWRTGNRPLSRRLNPSP